MLSVSSQRKYNFYHQNRLLDTFRTNSRDIIGRNPSKVIPLLANQDFTPMLEPPAFLDFGDKISIRIPYRDRMLVVQSLTLPSLVEVFFFTPLINTRTYLTKERYHWEYDRHNYPMAILQKKQHGHYI